LLHVHVLLLCPHSLPLRRPLSRPPHTPLSSLFLLFLFNATATTDIYTLSLHDALPISTPPAAPPRGSAPRPVPLRGRRRRGTGRDRKSTRLNSSHGSISYAVFCLKKKKIK